MGRNKLFINLVLVEMGNQYPDLDVSKIHYPEVFSIYRKYILKKKVFI